MLRSALKILNQSKKSYFSLNSRAFASAVSEQSIYEFTRRSLAYNENDGFVVSSPYEQIFDPQTTIERHIWGNLSKWPNHEAIVCGVSGRSYKYGALRDHCAALAIRLRKNLGVKDDDVVAVCLPNVPEYPIALLGSIESGVAVTTVNPSYTADEMSRQFVDSQPKVIFCTSDNVDVLKRACGLAKLVGTKVVVLKTDANASVPMATIDFKEFIDISGLTLTEASSFNENVDLNKTIVLPYSSGTTGLPKGVMHSHRSIISMVNGLNVKMPYEPFSKATTSDFQEVLPCFLPFYHIYGLAIMLFAKLVLGCKIISLPRYDVDLLLKILFEERATALSVVPPVVIHLGNYAKAKPEHFRTVKKFMCGAACLSQADVDRLKRVAPHSEFVQGFGMTEGITAFTANNVTNSATVGSPISNMQMKIARLEDPTFKGLGANETGELLVRGPNIMKGYYKNEVATRETILPDGWLRTGDIAHFDKNGLFYITERLKELIKVKGMQVAPAELEALLRQHPDILDAVVIGVPHPTSGEVPKAFIVRRPESKISEKDVEDFVAKQVINYKQLTGGTVFVESIPKSAAGKILRREIRLKYC